MYKCIKMQILTQTSECSISVQWSETTLQDKQYIWKKVLYLLALD